MSVRFRIRQGDEELRARSLQEFEALVRSGAVREEDMVHDALTGEWAPARAHPAFRLVVETMDEVPGEETPGDGATDEAGSASGGTPGEAPDELGFSMELVDEEERSPEEEADAFIREMERERREDPERSPMGDDVELFDGRSASLASPDEADPVAEEDATARGSSPAREPTNGSAEPESEREDSRPLARALGRAGGAGVRWEAPREPGRPGVDGVAPVGGGSRRRAVGILGVALLILGVTAAVAHPSFRGQETLPRSETTREARATRSAPPTDAELRGHARSDFLGRVDSLREVFALNRVPRAWLEGHYLSEASAFPEVGRFWTEYLRYVEQVYAEEEALYRDAYLATLERNGVQGPVRSLRLAGATEDFQAGAEERRERYAQIWELAVAARSLHQLLVEMEELITWEPAEGERLSADPVTEAVAGDAETQARLDEALDRVLSALYQATEGGRDVHRQEPDWLARRLAEGPLP